jgi:hypothetical protein
MCWREKLENPFFMTGSKHHANPILLPLSIGARSTDFTTRFAFGRLRNTAAIRASAARQSFYSTFSGF